VEQVTKRDGRFRFPVSEKGKYVLSMAKPGYPQQDYKEAGFAGVSSAIAVRDDQDTGNLVFEARRGGVISGLVKDEHSEAVGNALVTVFQSAVVDGERRDILRGQTRANAYGEFRLPGLPAGNYYVYAMGRPWFADSIISLEETQRRVVELHGVPPEPAPAAPAFSPDPLFRGTAFRPAFHAHAESIDQASVVRLETGGETQVSITLTLTGAVTVKGTINDLGPLSEGRAYLNKRVPPYYINFLEQWVRKDKTVEFRNVPPGSYEIVAASQAGAGISSWSIREPVEVGASDVEVTLRPQQLCSMSGRVRFEGERPAGEADLFVGLRNEKGATMRTEADAKGDFSMSRLLPGKYEVVAGSEGYVAEYLTGPDGERLPLTLTIAPGEAVHRDLTLTRAVSAIEGFVEHAGVPRAGAFVLLLPKSMSQGWAYRVDQTDSDGSYGLRTIPAGDYFLIALSDGEDVAFRDAKVGARLSEAARAVHVEPGDRLEFKLEVVSTASVMPVPGVQRLPQERRLE
jgi:hypothetical protein